ncbi:E2F transcription factor 5 [Phyllostomus discolor]|uniref:E2F transcription factor 5 n=1 Tax=Phyllostomus discolor TaxID=89673 RepID=A0A833ZWX4_9CHIR|nr:E2F transcription factor 5 [Phyllostomus discolor]
MSTVYPQCSKPIELADLGPCCTAFQGSDHSQFPKSQPKKVLDVEISVVVASFSPSVPFPQKPVSLMNSTFSYVTHEDICSCFNGDTLLAIQAPSGTQLEVPIPEMGQNGQKKYQINLKSHSGPIHVLLINKESSSSQPVVFPVPPPDDLTQPSSRPSTPRTSHKPSPATRRPPEQPTPEKDQGSQHMPATDLASAGSISGDIIDELMSSDVFPLLRLSPTPADDYNFNLDDNEGVCDLFDVQILNY